MSFTKFMRGFLPGAQKATDIFTEGMRERRQREHAAGVRTDERAWQEKQTQEKNLRQDIAGATDLTWLEKQQNTYEAQGNDNGARLAAMRIAQLQERRFTDQIAGVDEVGLKEILEGLDPEELDRYKGAIEAREIGIDVGDRAQTLEQAQHLLSLNTLSGLDAFDGIFASQDPDMQAKLGKMHSIAQTLRPALQENKDYEDQNRYLTSLKGIFALSNSDNFGIKLNIAADDARRRGDTGMENMLSTMAKGTYAEFKAVELASIKEEHRAMSTGGIYTPAQILDFHKTHVIPAQNELNAALSSDIENDLPVKDADEETTLMGFAKRMYGKRTGAMPTLEEAKVYLASENITDKPGINRFYAAVGKVHTEHMKGRSPGIFAPLASDPIVSQMKTGARAWNVGLGKASTALFGGQEDELLLGGPTEDPGAYIRTGERDAEAQQAELLRQEEEDKRKKGEKLGLSIPPLTTMLSPGVGLGQAAGNLLNRALR